MIFGCTYERRHTAAVLRNAAATSFSSSPMRGRGVRASSSSASTLACHGLKSLAEMSQPAAVRR